MERRFQLPNAANCLRRTSWHRDLWEKAPPPFHEGVRPSVQPRQPNSETDGERCRRCAALSFGCATEEIGRATYL